MNCHRCQAVEAEYFVYTGIKFKVCIYCAVIAKEIGLMVEVLPNIVNQSSTNPYGT